MDYLAALKFPFSQPHWKKTLLCSAVCFLIPIVGPIVVLGYLCYVSGAMIRSRQPTLAPAPTPDPSGAIAYQTPRDNEFPPFDFNRFGDYIAHGIWPFLVSLVITIPFLVIFYLIFFTVFFSGAFIQNKAIVISVVLIGALAWFLFVLIVPLFSTPIFLRAKLMQSFKKAFKMSFIIDFSKRVGLLMILNQFFLTVIGIPLMLFGYLTCGIGFYPAMALLMFINTAILVQTYFVYLSRGGEPTPMDASLFSSTTPAAAPSILLPPA